jgi:two-component system C4-dicarboxylate transport response regulator DctD
MSLLTPSADATHPHAPVLAIHHLRILLVEDDPAVRVGSTQAFQLAGLLVDSCSSAELAHKYIVPGFAGIVITDVKLPGSSGLELLRHIKAVDQGIPVILVTGHGDITMAVDAMRNGAYDFIEKPYSSEQLIEVARRAMEARGLLLEVVALRERLQNRQGIESVLLGNSAAMTELRRIIVDVADTNADVLIYGETGSGKEVVARCLHDHSQRKKYNFVALNCGAIPEALFESEVFGHESGAFTGAVKRQMGKIEFADNGSLFLDEIESMPMVLQIKLLRTLQERTIARLGSNEQLAINVRVIAAAKLDLSMLAEQNKFRADLYYRLNLIVLTIPPLRDRRDDIPMLFEHFVLHAALRYNRAAPMVTNAQMQRLMAHSWPGNVRELRNIADRFVLGIVEKDGALFPQATSTPTLADQVTHFERALIDMELRRQRGNVTQAGEILGLPKQTLYHKMQKYQLVAEEYK